jgi:hypothetical protein
MKKMKKMTSYAATVAGILALAGPAMAAGEPIRIGMVTTLSGPSASIGRDDVDGLNLALDHIGHTIAGQPVELVIEDDAASPELGRQKAEKLARDQELNRQQQEKAEKKAKAAQIKQLIEGTRLPKLDGDDYYNFVDAKKVKRIPVNNLIRDKLSRGSLAIVSYDGRYEIVPRDAALRIQERDERRVVLLNESSGEPDEDDPYKDYVVPDDLMW